MVILNALFAWLTEAGYLAGNPLALARRRRDGCLRAGLCRLCEDLDVNSRCANGHNALTAGMKQFPST